MTEECKDCIYYFERKDRTLCGHYETRSFCQALPKVEEIYRVRACIYYKRR